MVALMSDPEEFFPDKLSERAIRFCEEYCVDFNKLQAEIRAGYVPGAGPSLKDKRIIDRIEQNKARHVARVDISVDWILTKLKSFVETTPLDFFEDVQIGTKTYRRFNPDIVTPLQRQALKKVKETKYGTEVETVDQLASLLKIGEYLKMFKGEEQAPVGEDTPDKFEIVFHSPEPDKTSDS